MMMYLPLTILHLCTRMRYCGWLNIRGVPIFVVFVEGPIQDFSLQFSVRSMQENIMATDFEPHEGVILVQSTKIGTH